MAPEVLTSPEKPPPDAPLPFGWAWPLVAGALAGLLLRFVFWGKPGSAWSAMAGTFIYLAPAAVGAVTVYAAERQARRSWYYYIAAPFVANLFFVGGSLLILIEGLICAVVIVPMFSVLGSVGGLAMGIVCRVTNWPRHAAYAFLAAPLLIAGLGGTPQMAERRDAIHRTIFVNAPPSVVWQQLNRVEGIRPEEFNASWASRIGVPMPVSGITVETPTGRVRQSRWDKAVHFDEPITDWEPERYLRWTYRFTEASFPPHALDDHVLIGGHYFDLLDTSFTLRPAGSGTQLEIAAHYRISTDFNLYASWVAGLLIGNLLDTGLGFYRNRSEAAAAPL
jgi:hypothetical protein